MPENPENDVFLGAFAFNNFLAGEPRLGCAGMIDQLISGFFRANG